MAEDPVCPVHFGDIDDNDADSVTSEDGMRCIKLGLPEHIAAYLEKRELDRDIEPVKCDSSLLEKITDNYVIAKKIISNLSWQDKFLCKHVCSMWYSAVHTLKKEQLGPADFVINLKYSNVRNGIKFVKSSNFYTEPLAVFAFANTVSFSIARKCEMLIPSPCDPACEKEHYLIDVINQQVAAPKNCMLTVRACYLSYMPLPQSITYAHKLTRQMFGRIHPFIGGVYIPMLPDVNFHVINIKSEGQMQKEFFDEVDRIAQDNIIKGVLAYVSESYVLLTVEDIVFLNYFKEVQPNIPYALGGCIVEDTISKQSDIDHLINRVNVGSGHFISEDLISIGLFTVPKVFDNTEKDNGNNFDVFSLVLDSSAWAKPKIQSTINEFSKKVPHFEHSVVLKLSCVGRDQKHEVEQDYFRAAFPNTRLVGCYGNGELGLNHPACPQPEEVHSTAKRHRRDPGPQFGIMYSYSTVFVYIGWGKILSSPETTSAN